MPTHFSVKTAHNPDILGSSPIGPRRDSLRPVPAVRQRIRQFLCGLSGHEDRLHCDHDGRRVYVQCAACDRESPGWTIEERRLRRFDEGIRGHGNP